MLLLDMQLSMIILSPSPPVYLTTGQSICFSTTLNAQNEKDNQTVLLDFGDGTPNQAMVFTSKLIKPPTI